MNVLYLLYVMHDLIYFVLNLKHLKYLYIGYWQIQFAYRIQACTFTHNEIKWYITCICIIYHADTSHLHVDRLFALVIMLVIYSDKRLCTVIYKYICQIFLCGIAEDAEINNLLFLHTVHNHFSMYRNGLLRPEKENIF